MKDKLLLNLYSNDNLKKILLLGSFFVSAIMIGLAMLGHASVAYDEVAMKMIVSGELGKGPDAHIMFSNISLGYFLSFMYKNFNGIEWYYLWLLMCYYISFVAYNYRVLQLMSGKKNRRIIILYIVSVVFFCFLFYESIILLRFTYCAMISGAVFLFFFFSKDQKDKLDYFISLILLSICFVMRIDIFKMFCPFILCLVGYNYLRHKLRKSDAIFGFVAGTLMVVLVLLNSFSYQNEWGKALEINATRAAMQDYGCVPEYDTNQELYDKLNLSYWDYYVLRMTYWGLSDHLDVETLIPLKAAMEENNLSVNNLTFVELFNFYKEHLHDVSRYIILVEMIVFVFNICVVIRSSKKRQYMFLGIIVLCWGIEWLLLGIGGHLPYRVAYSMHVTFIFSLITFGVVNLHDNSSIYIDKNKKYYFELICFLLCVLMSIKCYKVLVEGKQTYEMNKSFFALEEYMESNADKSYICFVNEYVEELKIINPKKNNYTKMTGWIGETPSWQSFLREGYSTKTEALAKRKDLHFVTLEGDESPLFLEEYEAEKGYSVKYDYEVVSFEGVNYWIWSLVDNE